MSQPPQYTRQFDFTGHSTSRPNTPQPGVQLDAEFNQIRNSLNSALNNLALIQRDDTGLANGSVGIDQLDSVVQAIIAGSGFTVKGDWAASTAYVPGDLVADDGKIYLVLEAHNSSASLAADIASGHVSVALFAPHALLDFEAELAATGGAALIGTTTASNSVQALLDSIRAAIGVAGAASNMGAFTTPVITDNQSVKAGMEELGAAVGAAQADADTAQATADTKANASALGRSASDTNMGTYTGSTITDNQTAKQNIQELETAVELRETAAFSHSGSYTAGTVRKKLQQVIDPRDAPYNAAADGSTDDTVAIEAAEADGRIVDGRGLVYAVTAAPEDFSRFRNAAFKVGSVTHMTRDFLRTDTAKITDGMLYTAWAEDKAYLVGDQLRVWANEKESHTDGTARIVLYTSDDGGASWAPGEYLALEASGRTLWCAGFDDSTETEYLLVRVPSGSTDVAPYTYERWYRTVDLGSTADYNGAWTSAATTFPVPTGFTGQPVMVISFTKGHSSSIVVGASYAEGAAVMRSTDSGANWTGYILATGTDYEEPSVKYDATTQRYYGFMRNGSAANPYYWYSAVDDLSTITTHIAPSGTFGTNAMGDSNVPLAIRSGRIYAFGSYRSGTLEGVASDETTSAFYMDMPVTAGNIWTQASTKIYRLGTLPHRETGGSSAVGVGSVVIHEDKVHLFYGMEERTGTTAGLNRVANLYQTVVYLEDRGSMFDFRADMVTNRSAGPLRKMPGGNKGFVAYLGDESGDYPAIFSGRPNFSIKTGKVTIASGVATLSGRFGHYFVDTEASAASDDLDTITDTDVQKGDVIILSAFSSSRTVVVKHGTGNITCGSDRTLDNAADRICLQYNGTSWFLLYFADNGT